MSVTEVTALVGVLGGLMAFVVGLLQYRTAQRWKRLEFVATEIKQAFAEPRISLALQMLDWNANVYDLRSSESDGPELSTVLVGDAELQRAMLPHPERLDGFSVSEVRIRSAFDTLFEFIRRLEHFIRAGLLKPADLEPYLRYPLSRLCSTTNGKTPQVLHSLWQYISFYGYREVTSFVRRLGHQPPSVPAIGREDQRRGLTNG
jgi:hypothetical protein